MTTCVLLANGPSLALADISRVRYPMIGMNRSWMVAPDPAFHVCLERVHYDANPAFHERMAAEGKLYVAGGVRRVKSSWDIGHVMPIRDGGFSTDITKGVMTGVNGVGSVFFVALQVAYSLKFRKVYALGLDLRGDHFDGTPASPHVERQNELWSLLPSDLQVFTAGSPESRASFTKVGIEEVYGE